VRIVSSMSNTDIETRYHEPSENSDPTRAGGFRRPSTGGLGLHASGSSLGCPVSLTDSLQAFNHTVWQADWDGMRLLARNAWTWRSPPRRDPRPAAARHRCSSPSGLAETTSAG
jgi:hypothetical protein